MKKVLSLLIVGLVLSVSLSGCQKQQPTVEEPIADRQPAPTDNSASSTETDQPINNEAGLIEALARETKLPEAAKFQLHDTQVKGNYARGRFSYNNELKADVFWAVMSAGVWRLLYVDREGPGCALLADWPLDLKSGCREDLNQGQISNFADCLKAGFKATADQPRRCLDGKNNVFIEVAPAGSNKRYVSQEVTKCRDLDFDCGSEEKPFLDDLGCGCQRTTMVPIKNFCQPDSRLAEVCTQEYRPVCGWFNETIKCLRYPCANTYGNACVACQNRQVAYWTDGECPK